MSADANSRFNLILNAVGVLVMTIGVSVGGWFLHMVHTNGVETQAKVIKIDTTQGAIMATQTEMKEAMKDAMKVIVPRNEHERIWHTYDSENISMRADLARLWVELQAVKLDVTRIQQKQKD